MMSVLRVIIYKGQWVYYILPVYIKFLAVQLILNGHAVTFIHVMSLENGYAR
jgi:hypothetical protein